MHVSASASVLKADRWWLKADFQIKVVEMIGVLTHHWAKSDKIEEAKKLLDGNGLAQSKAPGFGSRETLYSIDDATKITTLVTWDSNEIYDAWRASPERTVAMAGAGELWSQPPESERFEVAG